MPINSFLYPGAKVTLGYDVDNSCRFNSGSSDYLNHDTGNSTTSSTKTTLSAWVKRSAVGVNTVIFGHEVSNSLRSAIYINDDDDFLYFQNGSNIFLTNRKFRDTSAWYHFVVTSDLTQATASNRVKFYVNGVQETSFSTENYPSQNASNAVPNFGNQTIGVNIYNSSPSSNNYFNGYMAEVVFIDGQALDPTSFGKFDDDSPTIWKPKDVSGLTFGTNGFYLDFENASSLGADVSGNSNNFTVNNLTSIDQSTDTCTNNFCTLNPLDRSTLSSDGTTFTEGNLKTTDASSNYLVATGTMAVTQGKWYFEVKIDATASHTASGVKIVDLDGWDRTDGSANGSYGWLYAANGDKRNGGSSSSYGDAFSANDIIGVAIDMDNKAVYFSRNGTFQASGNPASGASKTNAAFTNLTGTITAQVYDGSSGQAHEFSMNFGSPPYSISSGNSDANGYGNFEYAVPSGFYAINSKNLAEFG